MENFIKLASHKMQEGSSIHSHLLQSKIISSRDTIEAWFEKEWKKTKAPLYGSMDLRNSGFKIAPIDMNLFPAGFNNLRSNTDFLKRAVNALNAKIKTYAMPIKNILLIPEEHTRNLFYWENIATLLEIFTEAGFNVKLASLKEGQVEPDVITRQDGSILLLYPMTKKNNRIEVENFIPDLIVLNNDLSSGIPDMLTSVEQIIAPPAEAGWSERLKSEHFQFYAEVANEFGAEIQVDPWLVSPIFKKCGEINFMLREGEACMASIAENLLAEIQKKYDEYNITLDPYLVIKADAGTYGMGVMMIKDPSEILSLNRKQRTNMSKTKGGREIQQVIVQEGVHTLETYNDSVAEPVLYLVNESVIGGFYRVHAAKAMDENLNAPGMHFEPLPFGKACGHDKKNEVCANLYYTYGVIARLSMLAAARELHSLG